jgi:hypothetical protein
MSSLTTKQSQNGSQQNNKFERWVGTLGKSSSQAQGKAECIIQSHLFLEFCICFPGRFNINIHHTCTVPRCEEPYGIPCNFVHKQI